MQRWLGGLAIGLVFAGVSWAQEPFLTSADGIVLPAPEISGLSCKRIHDLLLRYQDSGYRQAGTIPSEGPNTELFAYEDALARHNYETCLLSSYDFTNPTAAFVRGFN